MIYCFLAVSAVVPSLLLVWYFHKRDVYPEPPRVLWATFGLGVLTVFPVVLIELGIQVAVDQVPTPVLRGALDAFLVAAFTEETFKLLVLLGYVWRHREFNEPMDGIVYGVVASLGFATFENVIYVFQSGIGVAVMRALTAVPSHATEGAILGYFVGQAKFGRSGAALKILVGYIAVIVIHGLYDFPLLSWSAATEIAKANGVEASESILLLLPCTVITLFAAVVWAWWLARRMRREQLSGRTYAPNPSAPAWPSAGPVGRHYLTDPSPARQAFPPPEPTPPPLEPPPLTPPSFAPPLAPPVFHPPPQPGPPPVYAPYPPRPVSAPAPGRWKAVVALVLGFLLGSLGGMVVLAIIVAFAIDSVKPGDETDTILGTFIIGVAPMIAGAVLFTVGIAKLNRGR